MTSSVDVGNQPMRAREVELAALDASIRRGIADAEGGWVHGLDDVACALETKYSALARVGGDR